MKKKTLKKIWTCLAACLFLAAALAGADVRQNPIKATYCDGSSLELYPYSAVNRSDGSSFNCYEVQSSQVGEGLRFEFEDADDGDYNDVIIDVWLTGNGSGTPVAHVRFVSKDASYSHAIHLVFAGTDLLVFKAEATAPGSVFDVPLQSRPCPDFVLTASPSSQATAAGGSLQFQIQAEASHGFNLPLALSLSGAPAGFSHLFTPNPFQAGFPSVLEIKTAAQTIPGIYPLTITASGGGISHTATVTVEVKPLIPGFLEKSFSLSQAYPGQQIEMTLLLKNNSAGDFLNIILWDELPAYLFYLDDDAAPKAARSGNKISWFFRKLDQGDKIVIRVRLQIAENCPPLEIRNLAHFQHSLLPEALASNPAVIKVQEFRIRLEKTVSLSQARPGATLEYQIKINNPAAQPLPASRLQDILAADLELVSQQGGLSFQQQGNTLRWTGEIPAGKETSVSFRARIRGDVVAGMRIANSASLESAVLPKPMISNTVSTTVVSDPIATAQVRFSKKVDTPQSEVGRIIRFRLVTENRSPSLLLTPRLEDSLPQGFDYVPGSSACDGSKLSDPQSHSRLNWQIPAIPPGRTSVLSFQVVIGADVRRGRNINRAVFTALDQSGQNLRLEAEEFINISTTTLVFYSTVEGSVFLDRDNDESYSLADTLLPGIEVRLSNGQRSLTDSEGRYSFQSLFPGDYALGLNQATLPKKYRVVFPTTKAVTLFDGLTDTVDFAVTFKGDDETPLCRLQGRVFFDKDPNQAFDAGEPLLADFTVTLDGSLQTTGKEGAFVFSKLPPGKHALAITFGGQTVRHDLTLPPGQTALDIPLPFSGIVITVQGEK